MNCPKCKAPGICICDDSSAPIPRDKDERIAELLAANVRFEARAREAEASLRIAREALKKARQFAEDEHERRDIGYDAYDPEDMAYMKAPGALVAHIDAALGENL